MPGFWAIQMAAVEVCTHRGEGYHHGAVAEDSHSTASVCYEIFTAGFLYQVWEGPMQIPGGTGGRTVGNAGERIIHPLAEKL